MVLCVNLLCAALLKPVQRLPFIQDNRIYWIQTQGGTMYLKSEKASHTWDLLPCSFSHTGK